MNIAFRADASIQIGTGHVMRCLTLAEELRRQGHKCQFICREHKGHLGELITEKGFELTMLQTDGSTKLESSGDERTAYADWLGASWQQDAEQTIAALTPLNADWLVVDHYALGAHWEKALRLCCNKIMVIDDLADRQHDCDLLLDQTFGRDRADYLPLIPKKCQLLCGAQFALLRPEFAQWRDYSLKRRKQGNLQHLLINLGGVDKDNVTTQILEALVNASLPAVCRITVAMGATAPWIKEVEQQAKLLPWPTEVKVGVNNMAELMANSDLALGAAGATSWERCCLGLPSVMVVLAENQRTIAKNLEKQGLALFLDRNDISTENIKIKIKRLIQMADKFKYSASTITSGTGAMLVSEAMLGENNV